MRKHKLMAILSAAALAVSLVSLAGIYAAAEEGDVKTGSCGENATYTLDSEGTLTISGSGNIEFDIIDSSIIRKDAKKVVIENEITGIGNDAFDYWSDLTEITIPDSVTSIGDKAFSGCNGLTEITIPNSVTSIGDKAFQDCKGLTKITIPNSVTSIGDSVFNRCDGLAEITIPDSVISIGNYAFSLCSGLTKITIPNSVTSIGDSAFWHCRGLTEITISDSVISIGNYAFRDCEGLKEITIPNSVTSIGDGAFQDCDSLSKVSLSNSVTSIQYRTFKGCELLPEITIPDSVTSIGESAFAFIGDSELQNIYFNGNAPQISSNAFKNVTANAYYPAENSTWTEAVKQNYGGTLVWTEQKDNTQNNIVIQPELTDSKYVIGSSGGATIKCSGELKDFLSVEVDNNVVDAANYTLKEGSTILTFLPKYLDTLSAGEHQIKFNYTDNRTVHTSLAIQSTKEDITADKDEKQDTKEDITTNKDETQNTKETTNKTDENKTTIPNKPVKTGDTSTPILWLLLAVLGGGACFSIATKKHTAK